ncbi:NAD-dependent deacylase [Nitrosopumilus zosterae]|uniref:NAD-dependent protein deacylase n=1 Tax=Nitrosopumilus zosterae TaxID=718286 RepID=A0A2S2KTQ6_9ARCH|nr:NAD-dependent deacylase [Nitrosopumilus zosterae]BDQ29938.1 NAD-dependent deacylase [Nitrosopumilus zosterae]GBH34961.1 NAD-dependent deacylase [Nitrosopumilus zosterae]
MFELIKDQIKNIKKVVFVTGAGISQESGIPTFRGKDGLWKNHDSMKLATIDAFYDNPKLVWEWYNERRKNIFAAQPNLGHKAIAELEKYVKVVVLTQNIDGLHQKAGSSEVLELHGSIIKIKCSVCNFNEEITSEISEILPLCKCGNILRPDVVWFGESLPQDVWQKAMIYASQCDLMVIVGTSLVVSPANTLPIYAKQNNALLIEINPDNTEISPEMTLVIRNTGTISLPEFVSLFKNK